jgi:hypothetical protein
MRSTSSGVRTTSKFPQSTRPLRLVVDVTVTDKTDMDRFTHEVTRNLERIIGVSVIDADYTNPENVLIRRESLPAPLGDVSSG